MTALQQYPFPGNVRELENTLERALTWAEGTRISAEDLMLPAITQPNGNAFTIPETGISISAPALNQDLESHLEEQERAIIEKALNETRWNKTAAAKRLGITFRALRYKLKKLDLE